MRNQASTSLLHEITAHKKEDSVADEADRSAKLVEQIREVETKNTEGEERHSQVDSALHAIVYAPGDQSNGSGSAPKIWAEAVQGIDAKRFISRLEVKGQFALDYDP